VIFIGYFDHDFPNLIKTGIVGSLIGQYISDLFFNLFVHNRKQFLDIITCISPTPAYIAATTAGFFNGVTNPYIDNLTSAGMRNIVYSYTNNYFSQKLDEEDIVSDLNMVNLVGDTMAVVIIVWAFNIHARENFYNHKAKKNCMPEPFDDNMDILTSFIIVFATNLYAYYKMTSAVENNSIERGLDIIA